MNKINLDRISKILKIVANILAIIGLITIVLMSYEYTRVSNIIKPYDRVDNIMQGKGFKLIQYIPSPAIHYLVIDSILLIDIAGYTTDLLSGNEIDTKYDYLNQLEGSDSRVLNNSNTLINAIHTVYNQSKSEDKSKNSEIKMSTSQVIEYYILDLEKEIKVLSLLVILQLYTLQKLVRWIIGFGVTLIVKHKKYGDNIYENIEYKKLRVKIQ